MTPKSTIYDAMSETDLRRLVAAKQNLAQRGGLTAEDKSRIELINQALGSIETAKRELRIDRNLSTHEKP